MQRVYSLTLVKRVITAYTSFASKSIRHKFDPAVTHNSVGSGISFFNVMIRTSGANLSMDFATAGWPLLLSGTCQNLDEASFTTVFPRM